MNTGERVELGIDISAHSDSEGVIALGHIGHGITVEHTVGKGILETVNRQRVGTIGRASHLASGNASHPYQEDGGNEK